MQTLLKPLLRWRSARGFGIHSPFAYRFVTQVLHPQGIYGWYAYRIAADTRFRLAVRLLAYFNPSSVALSVGTADSATYLKIIQAVCPQAKISKNGPAAFYITDSEPLPATSGLIVGKHTPELLEKAQKSLAHGMTFHNGRSIAAVAALPHLPRQDFELKF